MVSKLGRSPAVAFLAPAHQRPEKLICFYLRLRAQAPQGFLANAAAG